MRPWPLVLLAACTSGKELGLPALPDVDAAFVAIVGPTETRMFKVSPGQRTLEAPEEGRAYLITYQLDRSDDLVLAYVDETRLETVDVVRPREGDCPGRATHGEDTIRVPMDERADGAFELFEDREPVVADPAVVEGWSFALPTRANVSTLTTRPFGAEEMMLDSTFFIEGQRFDRIDDEDYSGLERIIPLDENRIAAFADDAAFIFERGQPFSGPSRIYRGQRDAIRTPEGILVASGRGPDDARTGALHLLDPDTLITTTTVAQFDEPIGAVRVDGGRTYVGAEDGLYILEGGATTRIEAGASLESLFLVDHPEFDLLAVSKLGQVFVLDDDRLEAVATVFVDEHIDATELIETGDLLELWISGDEQRLHRVRYAEGVWTSEAVTFHMPIEGWVCASNTPCLKEPLDELETLLYVPANDRLYFSIEGCTALFALDRSLMRADLVDDAMFVSLHLEPIKQIRWVGDALVGAGDHSRVVEWR